jgi:hypothetical protein
VILQDSSKYQRAKSHTGLRLVNHMSTTIVSLLEEVEKIDCMADDVGSLLHITFTAAHPRFVVDYFS